ncbi:MAG: hypothetical protein JWQ97_513 [Phenylobacterium sp.]|nr:hypothetical protein [Phenylobacterium sp.]
MKALLLVLAGVALLSAPLEALAQARHGGGSHQSSGGRGAWGGDGVRPGGGGRGGGRWSGPGGGAQDHERGSGASWAGSRNGHAMGWGARGREHSRYWAYGWPYDFVAFDFGLAVGLGAYPLYDPFWAWGPASYSDTEIIDVPPPYASGERRVDPAVGPLPPDASAPAPPAACGSWRWDPKTSQYFWALCGSAANAS